MEIPPIGWNFHPNGLMVPSVNSRCWRKLWGSGTPSKCDPIPTKGKERPMANQRPFHQGPKRIWAL